MFVLFYKKYFTNIVFDKKDMIYIFYNFIFKLDLFIMNYIFPYSNKYYNIISECIKKFINE